MSMSCIDRYRHDMGRRQTAHLSLSSNSHWESAVMLKGRKQWRSVEEDHRLLASVVGVVPT